MCKPHARSCRSGLLLLILFLCICAQLAILCHSIAIQKQTRSLATDNPRTVSLSLGPPFPGPPFLPGYLCVTTRYCQYYAPLAVTSIQQDTYSPTTVLCSQLLSFISSVAHRTSICSDFPTNSNKATSSYTPHYFCLFYPDIQISIRPYTVPSKGKWRLYYCGTTRFESLLVALVISKIPFLGCRVRNYYPTFYPSY